MSVTPDSFSKSDAYNSGSGSIFQVINIPESTVMHNTEKKNTFISLVSLLCKGCYNSCILYPLENILLFSHQGYLRKQDIEKGKENRYKVKE